MLVTEYLVLSSPPLHTATAYTVPVRVPCAPSSSSNRLLVVLLPLLVCMLVFFATVEYLTRVAFQQRRNCLFLPPGIEWTLRVCSFYADAPEDLASNMTSARTRLQL